jgi:hypothetical protein
MWIKVGDYFIDLIPAGFASKSTAEGKIYLVVPYKILCYLALSLQS